MEIAHLLSCHASCRGPCPSQASAADLDQRQALRSQVNTCSFHDDVQLGEGAPGRLELARLARDKTADNTSFGAATTPAIHAGSSFKGLSVAADTTTGEAAAEQNALVPAVSDPNQDHPHVMIS